LLWLSFGLVLTQREQIRLQVLELVAKSRPLSAILDTLVRGMEAENPAMIGSILLLDDEGLHLLHGAAPSLPEAYNRAIHGAAIGPCAGSCGTAAFRGERVIVSDISSDPLWDDYRSWVLPYGLKACWSQPIITGDGRVLGTFAMYYREPRLPTTQDLDIISAAANIAGIAIEHERGRNTLTAAYQQLESKETRLKQALGALEQSEIKYRTVFESSSDAIMLFDGKVFLDCNDATLHIFGCQSRDQFISTHPARWAPARQPSGEDSKRLAQVHLDVAFRQESDGFEATCQRLDGTQFPAEIWLTRMTIGSQTIILATVRDITDRKRAEAMLRESEERLRLAQDAAHIGTFDWDIPHNHITWSRWHEEMWGFKPGEFGGTYEAFSERVHPEDLPGINAEVSRCIAAREPFEREFRVVWPDDNEHWIQSRGEFIFGNDGQPLRMRGAVLEITERKKAGIALLKSQQQLRKVIDGLGPNTFLGLMTPDGTLVEANLSALAAAGLKPEDVLDRPFWDAHWWSYSALVQKRLRKAIRRAAEGNGSRYDERVRAVEDQFIDIDFSIEPVCDDTGKVEYLVPSANVITERKQAEKELQQLNFELEQRVQERTQELTNANYKLQELDRLKSLFIASMSHELRTPLNSIIGFTGIILQGMSGEINVEQRKQLGIVKNNAKHLLDLINDIIDVSKIESGAIELADDAFDLTELVQETSQALATAAAEKNLALSLHAPPALEIHSDRRRLKQILINLLDNAVKFTDVGEISIELLLQEDQFKLSVRDSGIGIDAQHQHRLFKAFSQIVSPIRQIHPGTGLGLYLSQKLALLLGGEITLTSAIGVGSCFTLTLPCRRSQKL
jgi:PAS domain S-box-containing protein